jgi:formate/nitrite transporter FocA (FNT family)
LSDDTPEKDQHMQRRVPAHRPSTHQSPSARAKPSEQPEDTRKESGTLDALERDQAVEHSSIRALVIHEVLREEGEAELERHAGSLAWSGLAAGLTMGFSFLGMALLESGLPSAPWARLIDSIGYTLGFLITILGKQALFTESTLTAVLPVLVRRDRITFNKTLRFWAIVLSCNLLGTFFVAAFLSLHGMFAAEIGNTMRQIAHDAVSGPFWPTLFKAILAGWLIAVMVWLLPSAGTSKILVIMFLTYIVGIGRFSHIVAGSVDSAFAVFAGIASIRDYCVGFLVPTLIGNTIGGVAMVALLNHAPLASELEASESHDTFK